MRGITGIIHARDVTKLKLQKRILLHKELFRLQTPRARAAGTPQTHLPTTSVPTVQVSLCKIGKTPDESGITVQALGSPDTTLCAQLLGLVDDFLVDFKERLNVVGSEGDGDEDEILLALFDKVLDGVAGLGA